MKRVFAFIGFSMAITLIVLNTADYSAAKYILAVVAVLFAVSLLIKNIRREKVVPIALGAALFSCLVFIFCVQSSVLPQKELDGKTAHAVFEITDIETKDDNGYLYTVKTKSIDIAGAPQNIKLKLRSDVQLDADYYESVNGLLAFYSYADNAFESYSDYSNNIYVRASLLDYDATGEFSKPLNYHVLQMRLEIKDLLESQLNAKEAGLALSVLTGDKRILSDEINDDFLVCGLSHLIAVSGMNMTVICFCFYYVLRMLKVGRVPCVVITLIAVFVYSGISGYSKSVIRSAVMIAVVLVAKLINTKADTLNSLGFSVFLICLNPFSVADPSAVLTVTAVLGLSVVKPQYDKKLRPKTTIIRYIYDALFAGVSVMLTTLPVIWLFFGKISLVSLFANIICVPVMETSLVFLILFCLFSRVPLICTVFKFASSFLIGALIEISDFFADKFGFLYFNISDSVFGVAIFGIILLAAVSLFVNKKISVGIISVFTVAAFLISGAFSFYDYSKNTYVTVTSGGGVVVYDKDAVLIVGFEDSSDCYALENITSSADDINTVALESLRCKKDIGDSFSNIQFVSDGGNIPYLCEHISAYYSGVDIIVTVHNNVFKITEDYVTINGYKVFRNVYDKFSEDENVTFVIDSVSQMQIRKD